MAVIWRGSVQLLEQPDSPEWSFGEQIRMIRRFSGPHGACLAAAPLGGAIGGGIASGLRVAESRVTRSRGGIGILTITYGNQPGEVPIQGQQLPDDEAEITDDEVEEPLKKHPLYASLTIQEHANVNTILNTPLDSAENTKAFQDLYLGGSGGLLALDLLAKLQSGFTHYPVSTPVYQLTMYYWERPATLAVGNVRETPPSVPIIPPAGLDWLRKPDRLSHNGTYWVLVRRWQGWKELNRDIYP